MLLESQPPSEGVCLFALWVADCGNGSAHFIDGSNHLVQTAMIPLVEVENQPWEVVCVLLDLLRLGLLILDLFRQSLTFLNLARQDNIAKRLIELLYLFVS